MDESKSGRALNSAEKAEADSLTNKQWLYIIGRSAERGNGDKKGRPDVILTVAERILSDIAAIATVIALGVAVFQISVGNWQFLLVRYGSGLLYDGGDAFRRVFRDR